MEAGLLKTPVWKALQNPERERERDGLDYQSQHPLRAYGEPVPGNLAETWLSCVSGAVTALEAGTFCNRVSAPGANEVLALDTRNGTAGQQRARSGHAGLWLLSLGRSVLGAPGVRHVALATREPAGRCPGRGSSSGAPRPASASCGLGQGAGGNSSFCHRVKANSDPARAGAPRNRSFLGPHE